MITRSDFEKWADEENIPFSLMEDRDVAWDAWQHQQRVINALKAEIDRLNEVIEYLQAEIDKRLPDWTDEDLPLPEDADIEAAHPKITRKYEIYDEAYRMVSAKRSKDSLVNLVNWLLTRSTLTDNLAQASGDN